MNLPDNFLEIKAEVYRVVRANCEKPKRKILEEIKNQLPDVPNEVIKEALGQLAF